MKLFPKTFAKTKEILAKFNRGAAKLDQKLESMKPSKDTTGLGFSACKVNPLEPILMHQKSN